jgi:outer membrane protein assembly complex protein YaeT
MPLARAAGKIFLAAGIGFVALLALVHTPWVEDATGRWALGRLRSLGITARVDRLRYNLLTRHVRVEGVSLATDATPQQPFLDAGVVDVALPWSVLTGRVSFDSIELDALHVTLTRGKDGSTNWPSAQGGSGAAAPIPIRRVVAHDVAVTWRDETLDARADVAGAQLDLAPGAQGAAGSLRVARPVRLQWQGREMAIDAQAQLAWDGARVTLASARLQSTDFTVTGSGAIGILTATPEFALTLAVAGSDLEWRGLSGMSANAAVRVDAQGLDVDRVDVRAAGGTMQARGRLAFDEQQTSRLTADWQRLDIARLLTVVAAGTRAPLAALADGHATASWTARRADAITATLEATTSTAQPARQRLGLRGTVSAGASGGTWHATIDQWIDEAVHVEGTAGGRVSSDALDRSTVTGHLIAGAEASRPLWRTIEKLDLAPGDWPPPFDGRAQADVVLSGTVGEPSAAAQLAITDWRQGQVGAVSLTSKATITMHDARVSALDARLGANALHARGSVSFDSGRLSGSADATVPAMDQILTASSPFHPFGALELSATIGGRVTSPVVNGRADGRRLGVAGQTADQLAATFRLAGQTINVERLELTQPDGRLTASGSYDMRTRAFAADVNASNAALAAVTGADAPLDISARVDAVLAASGTFDDPHGEGHVELRDARWNDRQLGRIAGTLTLAGPRLQSSLQLPDLFTTATVSLGLRPFGAFILDAQVVDGDLAALAARLAVPTEAPVTGTSSLNAHVTGQLDQLTQSRMTVDLQRLDARVGDVPVRATQTGTASWDDRGLTAGDFVFEIGRSELRVGGRLGREAGGTISASLSGTLASLTDVAIGLGAFAPGSARPDVDGQVSVAARVTGTLDRPEIDATAQLDEGRLSVAGLPPATGIALRASYAAGLLELTKLDGSWQGATVAATGAAPIGLFASRLPDWFIRTAPRSATAGHLTARLEALTPALLSPWVDAATLSQLGGVSSGTLTLESDTPALASVKGALVLDRAGLSVAGVRFDQQRPTRVEVQGDTLRIADWEWGGEGNRVSLGGTIGLDAPRTLDLSADGSIDLRALGAFLPDIRTAGHGALHARVTGTMDAPLADGRVDLDHGELRLASPQFIVSDLAGSLLVTRDGITVSDVYGSANGGTLSIEGRVGYAGLQLTDGRLAFTGRGMAMAFPEALKTEVNADLSLGIEGGHLSLGGDLTVLGGSYREPLSIAGGLLAALQQPEVVEAAESPSALDAMTLDVRITTSEDVVVDNNYAQLGLAADLRLRGTVSQPVLAGRAEAREGGRIFLGGNVYQIEGTGAVDFSNPSRIEPDLNITALARVSGNEIRLTLKGPPARLETTLTSDPPLAQSDIVSLLMTGQVQSDSGPVPAIGRDQLLAYLSGEFLGVAGRAVGLDTLRIEPGGSVRFDAGLIATETDPGSRLTFGKQVTSDVEVVFSKNLTDSGAFTWIVAYHPRRNVEVRVVSDDHNDRLYDFRHDITIGGGPAPTSAAPAVRPRIGAVRITGASGPLEAELRGRVSLTSGKTFDFFAWQQNRDRLEQFCQESGHRGARVIARRVVAGPPDAPTVDLEFEVRLGRRTIVDLSGAPQAAKLRRAIEALWSHSVFDAFLIDEATNAARAMLVADGYLRATVAAAMVPRGTDETHLVLTIEPGSRTDHRRIAFSGNHVIATERLDALVRASGLDQSAWLDAAPLDRAVAALYQNEGFLSATVAAGAPAFEGTAATLPVAIDEGPAFRVDRIEFAGANRQPLDELKTAFGLQPGAAFTRAGTARAVRALGDYYKARGFSRVTVAMTSHPDRAAGTVALAVTVSEGPREILRDVTIEGTRRTSPTLVSRELHLDVGAPVDPSAMAAARQRLYDTGIFRRVDVEAVPMAAGPEAGATPVEQPVRAQVTLDEWPPLRLRYGFQLDDQQKPAGEGAGRQLRPGVAGDLTYRNLFGRAVSAGVAARYTTDFRAARTFVTAPSLFGLPLTSNVYLSRSREQVGSNDRPFVTDKSDITFEQRFRTRGHLQIAYGYSFERNHTFDVNADPNDPFAFDIAVNVAKLTATGIRDTRDDLVDATRGQFFSATFEYGVSALGSDLRFAKQFTEQSYYRALGRGVVFATAGRLGLAAGYGQDVIPSERFFAGGGSTVRGYAEGTLGPRDVFGDAAGGNALLVLNEELRFPIVWRLRGVGFLDAGNVFATVGDVGFADLRVGAGFGLRVLTPFALLRIDLGTPVSPRPGESRTRWFFSIGQVF